MGDTHPFVSSENYALGDVGDSRTDLNVVTEQDGRFKTRNRKELFQSYLDNNRAVLLGLAIIFFVLTFTLFIATVVLHYSSAKVQDGGCDLDAFTSSVQERRAIAASQGKLPYNNRHEKNNPSQNFNSDKSKPRSGPRYDGQWSVTKVNGRHARPGELVFEDNFDTFNTSLWEHITHDSESDFFYYVNTRNNSFVKDGILYLKPTFTSDLHGDAYVENGTLFLGKFPSDKCKKSRNSAICWKNDVGIVHPIMAPMLTSQDEFNFLYGKLEIRAKMPAGDWTEPLMTLQPKAQKYGDRLLSGQVQIIDIRGNRRLFNSEGVNVGSEQNCPDVRFGDHDEKKLVYDCLSTEPDKGFDTDFHIYQVLWTPDSISLKIDDETIVQAPNPRSSMFRLFTRGRKKHNVWRNAENPRMAPFDQSFYLVVGMNVGGTKGFFSDDFKSDYPKPWSDDDGIEAPKNFWNQRNLWEDSWKNDNAALKIDYVRLYALNETTSD